MIFFYSRCLCKNKMQICMICYSSSDGFLWSERCIFIWFRGSLVRHWSTYCITLTICATDQKSTLYVDCLCGPWRIHTYDGYFCTKMKILSVVHVVMTNNGHYNNIPTRMIVSLILCMVWILPTGQYSSDSHAAGVLKLCLLMTTRTAQWWQ
jgi:hypothetical protein